MIPTKIQYCWFGRGEKPKLAQKCIASWKKYCPNYEIIEWNEDNFDFSAYPYAAYFLKEKKYAYLSDFVRLVVVYEHGGLYFDTDVELIRSPDSLLENHAYFGFETNEFVNTGHGFGSEAYHPAMEALLQPYLKMLPDEDGNIRPIGCPTLNTQSLLMHGLKQNGARQQVLGAEIYPTDYFNPYDDPTGRLNITTNTYSIHWYSKSALSKKQIIRSKLTQPLHRILGVDFFRRKR